LLAQALQDCWRIVCKHILRIELICVCVGLPRRLEVPGSLCGPPWLVCAGPVTGSRVCRYGARRDQPSGPCASSTPRRLRGVCLGNLSG
jgi:hypothetical protein